MALAWVAENIWAGSLCGLDLWFWNPWDSVALLGALTEASGVQWPGCDPWSLLGRRSIISLKILFTRALGSHLLAARERAWVCGREAMRQPRLCSHCRADDSRLQLFYVQSRKCHFGVSPVLCWGRTLDEEEVTQAGRFKGDARCLRNLAKKHMRLTAVLLTILCSLWKKNSENSKFSALSLYCKVACHQRELHRDFI